MNHTPEPWTVFQRNDVQGFAILAKRDGRTRVIAEHWPCTYVNQGRSIELAANARLIAAAPELLEACQEILRALTSPTRELLDSTRREMEPCERLLKEVIAKATRNPS
jgi:hypothetical protein